MPKTLPPSVAAARNRELLRQQATRQDKFNVLWWSNAPWAPTGYGVQTNAVLPRIQKAGHKCAMSSNYGLAGNMQTWGEIPVFPQGHQGYSQDVIFAHWQAWNARHPGPTALFTLYDVWVLDNPNLASLPVIASWVPIDHAPCPPKVLQRLRADNLYPIAMSQFGQQMIHKEGLEAGYVPHSVDIDLFHPKHRDEARRDMLNLDDRFIVMMTSTNKGTSPNRKAFAEQLMAFKIFSDRHDDAVLYMHSAIRGTGGIDLGVLIDACQLDRSKVHFVDQFNYLNGLPAEVVAKLMAGADVFLMTSRGEGFGIPAVEAQAAGTPVIVNDWTAQPELVGDGWAVAGQPDWDPHQGAWYQTPFVGSIVDALEEAYGRGGGNSDKARSFAEGYGHDVVFDKYWRPVLKTVADKLAAVGAEGGSGPGGGAS